MKKATLVLLLCITFASAMVVKDSVNDKNANWQFLAKFCFDDVDQGNFTFTATSSSATTRIVLYDDQSDSWPTLYIGGKYKTMSCEQLVNASKVRRTPNSPDMGIPVDNTGASQTKFIVERTRPRFWYVAVADCANQGVNLDYTLNFLNPGGSWQRQFGVDQQGLLPLFLVFFLLFTVGTLVHVHGVQQLYRAQSMHPIIKLLTIAIIAQLLAVLCLFIHYAVYAENGVGAPGLEAIGNIFDMVCQLVMFLELIVLSKGWTVSTNTLSDKKKLATTMGVLAVLYLILFIWQYAGLNPASTLYVYETAPGILLLIVRLGVMGWFLFNVRQTKAMENDAGKVKLYNMLSIAYSLWFIGLPFIVLISAAVDPWVRAKTTATLYLIFNALGLGILSVLLSPSRASDYFSVSGPDVMAGTSEYDKL